MRLASRRAVSKTAVAASLLRATLRKEAPSADLDAPFLDWLPAEVGIRGHRRNQETNSCSEGNAEGSQSTSVGIDLGGAGAAAGTERDPFLRNGARGMVRSAPPHGTEDVSELRGRNTQGVEGITAATKYFESDRAPLRQPPRPVLCGRVRRCFRATKQVRQRLVDLLDRSSLIRRRPRPPPADVPLRPRHAPHLPGRPPSLSADRGQRKRRGLPGSPRTSSRRSRLRGLGPSRQGVG